MTAASSVSAAFAAADFGDAQGQPDVWTDPLFHVDALHGDLSDRIAAEFFARTRANEANPAGLALSGPPGAGKSHLLSVLRRRVWERGGWFVRIDVSGPSDFWNIVAAEYSASLFRRMASGRTQAGAVLLALLARLSADAVARGALAGRAQAAGERTSAVDLLLAMLAAVAPAETQRRRDIVRALALCDSGNEAISRFAATWLQGGAVDEMRRNELGFLAAPPDAAEIVRGLLWILSLSGPTLIAVEGVDAVVARSMSSNGDVDDPAVLKSLAGGLLALHDVKRRAMTIVACREESARALFEQTSLAAAFRRTRISPSVRSADLVERLVAARLTAAYAQAGFSPPYPTFPFTRAAIASAVGLSPRELLRRCWQRQQACLAEGGIRECASLAQAPVKPESPDPPPAPPAPEPLRHSEIFIGRSAEIGEVVGPVTLPSELLARHVAVLAGAGKGALLSRLIQEAALAGVPALVLDLNGDFTRLGEPWPSRPTEFSDEDARKAKAYFERVETVLWTPGLPAGLPMTLSALPDFAALRRGGDSGHLEARELAIEMAVATLEPHLPARGPRAIRLRGALVDALRVFVRDGGGSLDDFVGLLDRLPESASRLAEGAQNAREIAEQLRASLAADPLLRQGGEPLDPARLFKGAPGKTRVSVIHLAGLGAGERVAFVHRLQMALFCWIGNHRSTSGRLVVLDEAHLYLPGKETTAAKRSAFALIKQASSFGDGLVFASPAPRALDPGIVASCLTRLYGGLGSASDAATVAALMAKTGGAADDLARLKPGEFYFASETHPRPIKLRASFSLSRRTLSPPHAQELAAIARRGAKDA